MVWLCFPGMTSSLANHRCTLWYVFSTIFLFLTFLNIHIYFIILKPYDQQFTLTTKKSLHIIFKAPGFCIVQKHMPIHYVAEYKTVGARRVLNWYLLIHLVICWFNWRIFKKCFEALFDWLILCKLRHIVLVLPKVYLLRFNKFEIFLEICLPCSMSSELPRCACTKRTIYSLATPLPNHWYLIHRRLTPKVGLTDSLIHIPNRTYVNFAFHPQSIE